MVNQACAGLMPIRKPRLSGYRTVWPLVWPTLYPVLDPKYRAPVRMTSRPAENENAPHDRNHDGAPQRCSKEAEPREEDEGTA